MSALLGTLLNGRFRLDAEIGTGGMSVVYRARDLTLERPVAIKLLNRDMALAAGGADQLERFRREARAVARLSHPHIVTVIDAGEEAPPGGLGVPGDPPVGRPYIVFEYVEGETLKARIRRLGRLPIPEAVAYAIEIARALGAAHQSHIVHRDVKPQNVLIDEEGSAKVTDFGIARSLDEEGLTADGRVLGTTDYVSPEQALGHPVTGQSDLYSLGIVLYEMLTGEVPFHGDNQVSVAMKHVREALPDVQARRHEVSSALAAVVDRATARELEARYPSATEMLVDLEDALAVETARAGAATGEATAVLRTLPNATRRRLPLRLRHPLRALGATLLVAAGIAVAVVVVEHGAQNGTGPRGGPPKLAGTAEVSLGQKAARDFDPYGSPDQREHPADAANVVDGEAQTTWSTEHYGAGDLGKPGVGIWVATPSAVAATQVEVRTPTPGFRATVYAAPGGPPARLGGWTEVASPQRIGKDQSITLGTAGRRYRYYLVWITKLAPGQDQASISEISVFAHKSDARRASSK